MKRSAKFSELVTESEPSIKKSKKDDHHYSTVDDITIKIGDKKFDINRTKFIGSPTGKDFLKNYKLRNFIASGGYGSVYKGN